MHPALTRRRCLQAGAAAFAPALLGWPGRAHAAWPDKAITLVVPFGAGGIADITARAVAEQLQRSLGQAVVVDNRPGAGSIVGSQAVLNAKPDGHTLLLMSNGHAVSVGLYKKLPYDVQKDFAPISLMGSFDLGLFVGAGSRFTSVGELVAYAKAHPGQVTVGTITPGSTQHLAAKLFESMAGINTLEVPYKGSPAALTALRAGEVDLVFEILGPMLPQVASGAVRALAVSGPQRHPALPQVPTVQQAAAGTPLAGYQVSSWNALAAPAGTPPAVLQRLGEAVREAVATPAVQARLAQAGVRPQAGSAAELQQLLASEIRRWGEVIRAAKIEAD